MEACSAEQTNFISTVFHNTTAHYNAYFYANQKMKEVQDAIEENHQNNFNEILKVYSDVDSSVIRNMHDQLEDCIRKASIAIQRHPNSKWVDDCYILVGKARYYMADFVNAIETFKYVNTKSKDDNARHEALVWLMRTFLDHNEENNAIAVSDYLKKEKLNKKNDNLLELTRAYRYQQNEDYDEMVKHLTIIASDLKRNQNAARIYFIIAQVYQQKGFEAEAYNYYEQCLKSNPEYELSFYAKLNMAQVTELADQNDVRKIRKYFKKLLRDRKNEEFRDKIYYEMANFELKQENYDQALDYYKLSVASSLNNSRQKSYSFLKLGEIYFDHLRNYETAKAYYDSTVLAMPKDDDLYQQVSDRQKILENFVNQVNTIQLQDSLLNLANMDSIALYAYLNKVIEERNQAAKEEASRQKRQQRQIQSSPANFYDPFSSGTGMTLSSGATWYFYNQNAVSQGQNEFRRIWGDRTLEDHWRRSNKAANTTFVSNIPAVEEQKQSDEELQDPVAANNNIDQMLASIPFSEEARQEALNKIETAYYNLGKIYDFQLNEENNAVESFKTLLGRFPESEFKPEVLYLLYLIHKNKKDPEYQTYGNMLVDEFPNTSFAKLVLNPNYREESNIESEKLKKYYKQAYAYFQMDSLNQAMEIIDEGTDLYPDNSFSDNMALLKILIYAKTDGIYKYEYELQQFDTKYPESELTDYVHELLKTADELKISQAKQGEIQFIKYYEQEHYFVLLYPLKSKLSEEIPQRIENFNKNQIYRTDLKTGNLIFDDDHSMVLINEFANKDTAMEYYKKFNSEDSPMNDFSTYNLVNFVISKDNFQILYQTKGIDEYLKFFKKNYR